MFAMKMKTFLLAMCLFCTLVASAQYQDYSQMGKTPAELRFIDDPLKIDLKEPSWFWHYTMQDAENILAAFTEVPTVAIVLGAGVVGYILYLKGAVKK